MRASIATSGLDAAGVRLLPPLGRLRRRWMQRHELVQALRVVPNIVQQVAGTATSSWSVADARWTDNRVAVIRLVPEPGSPPIIVKVAATVHGAQSLARERAVLDALREVPGLEDWRVRVPTGGDHPVGARDRPRVARSGGPVGH